MAFINGRSADDALLILEEIFWKSLDNNIPLWIASLDLQKAFDRVKWVCVDEALADQGVELHYRQLLFQIYTK